MSRNCISETEQSWEQLSGVTVFEIPIYAMSPDKFEKRWRAKKASLRKVLLENGYPDDKAKEEVNRRYFYSSVWKYNLLVGMLQLTVRKGCLYFNLYCNKRLTPRIDMKPCARFHNCFLLNVKIEVMPYDTDNTLIDSILQMIHSIQITEGVENYYFDCEAMMSTLSTEKIRVLIERLL